MSRWSAFPPPADPKARSVCAPPCHCPGTVRSDRKANSNVRLNSTRAFGITDQRKRCVHAIARRVRSITHNGLYRWFMGLKRPGGGGDAHLHYSSDGLPDLYMCRDRERHTVVTWHIYGRYPPLQILRDLYQLTPRQARVAQLLWLRRTNHEIAKLLGVSLNTARRHVEAVLRKLGTNSRWDVERIVATTVGYKVAQQLMDEPSRDRSNVTPET